MSTLMHQLSRQKIRLEAEVATAESSCRNFHYKHCMFHSRNGSRHVSPKLQAAVHSVPPKMSLLCLATILTNMNRFWQFCGISI